MKKAPNQTRTDDPFITSEVLYQLSYRSNEFIIYNLAAFDNHFFEKNKKRYIFTGVLLEFPIQIRYSVCVCALNEAMALQDGESEKYFY